MLKLIKDLSRKEGHFMRKGKTSHCFIQLKGMANTKVRKRLSNKTLLAKKGGFKALPVVLDATFNPISVLNLLCPVSWAIDLGTGKCCKWTRTVLK